MPHVLGMPAVKDRHPIPMLVSSESRDRAFHNFIVLRDCLCPPTPFLLAPIIVSELETMLFSMTGLTSNQFDRMLLLHRHKLFDHHHLV